MEKYPPMGKCLSVGIILLFLTIEFSPIINAHDNPVYETIDRVPITILECKADGTVQRTVFMMSPEQADSFHDEMRNAQDLDTRLYIYKKYYLIPQDVTVNTLRAGMQEKAQKMGLTQDKLERMVKNNRTLFNKQIYVNTFCSVDGINYWEGREHYLILPFGTTLITYPFSNAFPFTTNFDVLDYIIGRLHFRADGKLGEFYGSFRGVIKMVGFVGYMYWSMFIYRASWVFSQEIDGFAVYIRAIGTFS